MKKVIFTCALTFLLASCKKENYETVETSRPDTVIVNHDTLKGREITDNPPVTAYSNDRFRNVTAVRGEGNVFTISGEAQVYEANVSWVIEDGHNELKSGHATAASGAPSWGKFSFPVDATKDEGTHTLNLILFEESAKDGSRQHQLPVLLW
jgi:hypothetical protein